MIQQRIFVSKKHQRVNLSFILQALCHDTHRFEEPVRAVVQTPLLARIQGASAGAGAFFEAHLANSPSHCLHKLGVDVVSDLFN